MLLELLAARDVVAKHNFLECWKLMSMMSLYSISGSHLSAYWIC
jgi:hypothetical protein